MKPDGYIMIYKPKDGELENMTVPKMEYGTSNKYIRYIIKILWNVRYIL